MLVSQNITLDFLHLIYYLRPHLDFQRTPTDKRDFPARD